MSTVPLPPIGGPGPATRPEGIAVPLDSAGLEPAGAVRPGHAPRWLRGLEVVAGILSAGVLVLGVALLVSQVLAPRLGGTGLESATGPGWARTLGALGIGVVGETLRAMRRRWTSTGR